MCLGWTPVGPGALSLPRPNLLGGVIPGPCRSPLLELALVLVRFDHVASFIVNANHSVM
jgi:hypothetical protein